MDPSDHSLYNSQNFDPSQDYYPSFENYPTSDEFPNADFDMNSQFSQNPTNSPILEHQPSPLPQQTSNAPCGWSDVEDEALMFAYCFVSTNAIVGTGQKEAVLWKKVHDLFKQSPGISNPRTVEALRQCYRRLNKNVTAWVGAYQKAHGRAMSGQSKEDIEKQAQALYGKTKFTHHVVFDRVMRHHPKWKLKLVNHGCTRFQPDDDNIEESHDSSKRSRTEEDGDFATDSTPETPGSDSSILQRPTGRDTAKAKAKRKGKGVASQSYALPDDFTAELRQMRITRKKEIGMQERKMKTSK